MTPKYCVIYGSLFLFSGKKKMEVEKEFESSIPKNTKAKEQSKASFSFNYRKTNIFKSYFTETFFYWLLLVLHCSQKSRWLKEGTWTSAVVLFSKGPFLMLNGLFIFMSCLFIYISSARHNHIWSFNKTLIKVLKFWIFDVSIAKHWNQENHLINNIKIAVSFGKH